MKIFSKSLRARSVFWTIGLLGSFLVTFFVVYSVRVWEQKQRNAIPSNQNVQKILDDAENDAYDAMLGTIQRQAIQIEKLKSENARLKRRISELEFEELGP